ncbi:MAG: hypothetical protein ACPHP1_09045 [Miltoncostaeaceae bacterium]
MGTRTHAKAGKAHMGATAAKCVALRRVEAPAGIADGREARRIGGVLHEHLTVHPGKQAGESAKDNDLGVGE